MKILVMGGTGFFGKRLVNLLLKDGHQVSVLTRGNAPLDFIGDVESIKCDRNDRKMLLASIQNRTFDVIYDQLCFDYNSASMACDIFKGKTNHYIFTSSQSVYDPGKNLIESDFEPENHLFEKHETADSNYAEAKRQAEVGFIKNASFKLSFVRFPIVIGEDDYTNRFKWHLNKITSEEEIYFPNLEAKMSFIYSEDAAHSLKKIGENGLSGPINCCSGDALSLKNFLRTLEDLTKKKAILATEANEQNHSPYGIGEDWFMSNQKAATLGLSFLSTDEVLKLSFKKIGPQK